MALLAVTEQAKNIKIIRKGLRMSQKEFSDALNVKQGHYSRIETGKTNISYAVLESLTKYYHTATNKVLNLNWLLMGEGKMDLVSTEENQKILQLEAQVELLKSMVNK